MIDSGKDYLKTVARKKKGRVLVLAGLRLHAVIGI